VSVSTESFGDLASDRGRELAIGHHGNPTLAAALGACL
jgi:hypothetical protein